MSRPNGKPTCLEIAADITSGQRNHDYGDPIDNHRRVKKLWNAYLSEILRKKFGVIIEEPCDEYDVCWMNALQKIGREINLPLPDNKNDVCGWTRNVEMIEDAFSGFPTVDHGEPTRR